MLGLRVVGFLSSVLTLTACVSAVVESPGASPPATPVSVLASPLATLISALPKPTLPPTATPLPTDVPTATPTPTPTRTPEPTLLPTLTTQELSSEAIAHMAVWRAAQNDALYALYQVSDTPLGVTSIEWSPGDANLWLNVAMGPGGWGNYADTTSLVTNRETRIGWNPSERGDSFTCYRSHDWSPDGKQIAYDHNGQVWLADADGNNEYALSLPQHIRGASLPKFSPDGKQLAMTGWSEAQSVYRDSILIYEVSSGTLERVIDDAGRGPLVWAPASDGLAMLSDEIHSEKFPLGAARLWIIDLKADKTIAADLDELPGTEGCLAAPTWMLDGQKILASVLFRPGTWLVDRNGLVERLGPRSEKDSNLRSPGLSAPHFGGPCYKAVPSPDGIHVMYMVGGDRLLIRNLETNQDTVIGQGNLCYGQPIISWAPHAPLFLRGGKNLQGGQSQFDLVNAVDGSVTPLIANAYQPAWSPDGQRIAYWSQQAAGLALSLFDLSTKINVILVSPSSRESQVSRPYEYDTTPRWSADGKSIAFVAWREDLPEVYVVQVP